MLLKNIFSKLTIKQVLLLGLIVRLIAVVFSKGYAFHDDHFGVVELAWQWRDGINFNWTGGDVYIFSLVYAGIHYLLIGACEKIGINNPQDIMFVIRLFHALFSLLAIYFSYKLVLRLISHKTTAIAVSLIFALFWIFPFMSVRNLQEFFCVPFLLMGSYYLADTTNKIQSIILAALFFSLAFTIRMQTVFIPFGTAAYMLFRKESWKKALLFGVLFLISLLATQGLFDYALYGNPIASVKAYFEYNANPENIKGYPQGPWYQYIGTVAGIVLGFSFIPLIVGYFKSVRISSPLAAIFFGTLFFFIFHSWYSNKQERFILPFIPYFILLGIIGYREVYENNLHKKWLKAATKFFIGWFVIVNTIGLVVITFTYSKKSRVEAMSYLRKKGDITNFILEGAYEAPAAPLFYLGKHLSYYSTTAANIDSLPQAIMYRSQPPPNYIILTGNKDFENRLARLKKMFPLMKEEKVIKPGFVDNLAYWLNPKHNLNENWYIYSNK